MVQKIKSDGFEKIKTIVDLGCGPGHFASMIDTRKYQIKGYDFSKVAIQQAQKRCPEGNFHCVDLTTANFCLESDAYVSHEFFEHIEPDLEIIQQIPTGKLCIFSVPGFDSSGHVRHFKNKTEVWNRYRELLTFISIVQIGKLYLTVARRKMQLLLYFRFRR